MWSRGYGSQHGWACLCTSVSGGVALFYACGGLLACVCVLMAGACELNSFADHWTTTFVFTSDFRGGVCGVVHVRYTTTTTASCCASTSDHSVFCVCMCIVGWSPRIGKVNKPPLLWNGVVPVTKNKNENELSMKVWRYPVRSMDNRWCITRHRVRFSSAVLLT